MNCKIKIYLFNTYCFMKNFTNIIETTILIKVQASQKLALTLNHSDKLFIVASVAPFSHPSSLLPPFQIPVQPFIYSRQFLFSRERSRQGSTNMADFTQTATVKTAVRELAAPEGSITTFTSIITIS